MLFGVPATKDAARLRRRPTRTASSTSRSRDVVAEVGDATGRDGDLCLDEFTDHGHCGVLDRRRRASTTTRRWSGTPRWRVAQAAAGRPRGRPVSGMMDGQVGVVRARAGRRRLTRTPRSWPTPPSTPPRSTARSARPSSRTLQSATGATYQQDPPNRDEALREVRARPRRGRRHRHGQAGAALPRRAAPRSPRRGDVPVAAYQVSGEYAMVEAAAANGWIDRERDDPRDADVDPPGRRRHRADLLGGRGRRGWLRARHDSTLSRPTPFEARRPRPPLFDRAPRRDARAA